MITKAVEQFSGPAYVAIGNPTVANGGGMTDLSICPEVTVKVDFFRQSATNEIGQALADGQYGAVQGGTVTLTLQKQTAAIMAALFPEITVETASRGFDTAFQVMALDTLCIMPIASYGNGPAGANVMWCPAVRPDDLSELRRVLQSGSGASDDANPYTAAIDSKHNMFFFGDPADGGSLTWTLPTGY
jgi:hypothetical protein